MATASNAFSICLMDASFDLDDALILPPNFGHQIAESKPRVADLPNVSVDSDDVCSVCMENFEGEVGGKEVPCGHVFHAPCISSWLSNSISCPLCRFNISSASK